MKQGGGSFSKPLRRALLLLPVVLLAFGFGMLARKIGLLSEPLVYVPGIAAEPIEPGVTYSRIMPEYLDYNGRTTSFLQLEGIDGDVFAFVDKTGEMQFRLLGTRITYRDGEPPKGERGYFPVEIHVETVQDGYVFSAIYPPNVAMEEDVAESAGQCIPMEYPDPDHLPYGLTRVDGTDVYAQGSANSRQYFVYGAFEGKDAHFWLANNTGSMVRGSLPVILQTYSDGRNPEVQHPLTVRRLDTRRSDGSAATTTVICPMVHPLRRSL